MCSTKPSCSLMGPRWLIYPILSYPCNFKSIYLSIFLLHLSFEPLVLYTSIGVVYFVINFWFDLSGYICLSLGFVFGIALHVHISHPTLSSSSIDSSSPSNGKICTLTIDFWLSYSKYSRPASVIYNTIVIYKFHFPHRDANYQSCCDQFFTLSTYICCPSRL